MDCPIATDPPCACGKWVRVRDCVAKKSLRAAELSNRELYTPSIVATNVHISQYFTLVD